MLLSQHRFWAHQQTTAMLAAVCLLLLLAASANPATSFVLPTAPVRDGGAAAFVGNGRIHSQRPQPSLSPSPSSCDISPFAVASRRTGTRRRHSHSAMRDFGDGDYDNYAEESLRSLADYHTGTWRGRAKSWTVSADVAAGILRRSVSPEYEVAVNFGVASATGGGDDPSSSDSSSKNKLLDFAMTETASWMVDGDAEEGEGKGDGGQKRHQKVSSRTLSLGKSNVDVDDVDGSYSLDSTLPGFPPPSIAGTDRLQQFSVEHCLAAGDDLRYRAFAVYGADDQSLIRVVVCEEKRVPEGEEERATSSSAGSGTTLTPKDLVEMQSDVDRLVDRMLGGTPSDSGDSGQNASSKPPGGDRLEQLQRAMSSSSSAAAETTPAALTPHPTSLLELHAGVWLGDAVVRNTPAAVSAPASGKGFGSGRPSAAAPTGGGDDTRFADWSVGVQKVAWRWMWNFGDEIRRVVDAGRSMGAVMDGALKQPMGGSVAVNEGLSRRMPKEDRMVFIDWDGDNVGFVMGNVYVQVPRYAVFDRSRQVRPFYTEFCVFQSSPAAAAQEGQIITSSEDDDDDELLQLPDVVCSKMSRVYDSEGHLKQGSTSFFTFKRFGTEKDAL